MWLCKESQIVTTNLQNQQILCQPCQPKQLIVRNRKCLMRRISWICQSRLFRKPKIGNFSKARKRLSPAPAPALAGPSRWRSVMRAPMSALIMSLAKTRRRRWSMSCAATVTRRSLVAPGAIRTPINMQAWDTPEHYAELLKLIPYKRIGEPEEIGRVAVWLASDESDYIQGATLFVDGGMTLYPGFETGG